jgi:anti-sigma regulatory factor (Ser/Thr protein kinase)
MTNEQLSTRHSRTFTASFDAVVGARQFVAESFADAPLDDRSWLFHDAELVVSELVTNGIEHGVGSTVTVHLMSEGARLEVTVTSTMRHPGAGLTVGPSGAVGPSSARAGRGLRIVAALSSSVGTVVVGDELTVTCVLPRSA